MPDEHHCDHFTGVLQQLLNSEEEDPLTQWQSIHQQWASSPDARAELLLLYSRDCREFCDVMQAFSQLLKSFGNMKVNPDALEMCHAAVSRQ
jgi:hypothetical protein